jgi:hypothetical protein
MFSFRLLTNSLRSASPSGVTVAACASERIAQAAPRVALAPAAVSMTPLLARRVPSPFLRKLAVARNCVSSR